MAGWPSSAEGSQSRNLEADWICTKRIGVNLLVQSDAKRLASKSNGLHPSSFLFLVVRPGAPSSVLASPDSAGQELQHIASRLYRPVRERFRRPDGDDPDGSFTVPGVLL